MHYAGGRWWTLTTGAELRWDTPWPVLGEYALYSAGPRACSPVWAAAGFLQLKPSEKSDCFPPGNQFNCSSPHSCPKIFVSITTTHPESCIPPRLLPPGVSPCRPVLLRSPLLAEWNASYQIQKADVGRGAVPRACWCSAVTRFRFKFIYKACIIYSVFSYQRNAWCPSLWGSKECLQEPFQNSRPSPAFQLLESSSSFW